MLRLLLVMMMRGCGLWLMWLLLGLRRGWAGVMRALVLVLLLWLWWLLLLVLVLAALVLVLVGRGLWVDGDEAVHAKLPQLTLCDIRPPFICRRVGRGGMHHAMKTDIVDVMRRQGFLRACVCILPNCDHMIHFEQRHHVQKCLVTQRVQLSQHFDRHVRGRHVFTRLCHERQRAQVVDGAFVKERLGSWTQPPE
jgi:hypothetical protein